MSGPSSDRNLLLGIVALQMDFISRDALIGAMHQWTIEKSKALSEILGESGALDPADRLVLENLVERHIARHGGDPEQSLSSLDVVSPDRTILESLDDSDIRQSLSKLGTHTQAAPGFDPDQTGSWAALGEAAGGRYRILQLHDQGGIGSVFLARDGEVNREVALKQLKEEVSTDPQSRARFIFEAEITGNLEHPGVVPIYGKGVYADGRPYYAMRFVRGDNLKIAVDRFHKDPALRSDSGARHREFQKLLRRFLVVCETMAYVHSRGVLHRDIKPRNILLGPYGETLIVDWGLAKVVGHAEPVDLSDPTLRPPSSSDVQPTLAGSRVGTPSYMSPEQARGEVERLGPTTDVYSLGATLYYMLTGKPPFTDDDIPAILRKVERGEFRPPREIRPKIDRALDAICRKAMALKPEDRYPTSRALADDLEHWLADQPVSAYKEPISARTIRWLRQRKRVVAAAAALLVLALLGLGFHDWSISQEKVRTSEQLIMTRRALRELLGVAGERLAFVPDTEKLREELAKLVLARYRELGDQFPNDPGVRLETAHVYRVIAAIERITGQFETSRSSYDQAIAILSKLSRDEPSQTEYWRWLAETCNERGSLFQMNGKSSEAEKDFQQAIAQIERTMGQPLTPTYRRVKAAALINLSENLILKKQPEKVSEAAGQAVDLLQPLAEAPVPSRRTPGDRWLISLALCNRGIASRTKGDEPAAKQDFDLSEEYARRIIQDNPKDNQARLQLACVRNQRGKLLAESAASRADSMKCYQLALDELEKLINDFKLIPAYREEMANTLLGRADVLLSLGHFDLAETDARTARERVEQLISEQTQVRTPQNPQHLSLLGRSLEIISRIHRNAGRSQAARQFLQDAIDKLEGAVRLDPARRVDELLVAECRINLGKLGTDGGKVSPSR